MRRSNLIAILVALTFAPFPCLAGRGGISGGGGGTTNPSPVGPERIFHAVRLSKILLTAWLNEQHRRHLHSPNETESLTSRLFTSEPDAFARLDALKVEVRQAEACRDPEGHEVDGSAVNGVVCISAFNLSRKLSEYDYEFETAALVMHELAHLLGFGEADATELQRRVARALLRESAWTYVQQLNLLEAQGVAPLQAELLHLEGHASEIRCERARNLHESWHKLLLRAEDRTGELRPLRGGQAARMTAMAVKTTGIEFSICANDLREDEGTRALYAEKLGKAFGSDAEVTVNEFVRRAFASESNYPGSNDLKLRRITDVPSLIAEIRDLEDFLGEVRVSVRGLQNAQFDVTPR